jgi:alpha-tubulin suppressor-like RCC1 family protein
VLDSAGQVLCVGDNSLGLLGFGEGTPILPGFTNVITRSVSNVVAATWISAGGLTHCAPLLNGSARCWGSNSAGQLGITPGYSYVVPQTVNNLGGAVEIANGTQHSCARRNDGSVWCWGLGDRGQLGDGTNLSHYVATPVVNL